MRRRPAIFKQKTARPMRLTELFVGTLVLDAETCGTRDRAILALLYHLAGAGHVSWDAMPGLHAAILEREALGGTGMSRGIAIPHARHAGITRMFGAVARATVPLTDYGAIDAAPVDLLFLLLAPADADRPRRGEDPLVRRLRQRGFLDALRAARTADELRAALDAADNGAFLDSDWL
jgi:mannitol/fructose-specific phosphotransferase system IIA component (Ntr-type)